MDPQAATFGSKWLENLVDLFDSYEGSFHGPAHMGKIILSVVNFYRDFHVHALELSDFPNETYFPNSNDLTEAVNNRRRLQFTQPFLPATILISHVNIATETWAYREANNHYQGQLSEAERVKRHRILSLLTTLVSQGLWNQNIGVPENFEAHVQAADGMKWAKHVESMREPYIHAQTQFMSEEEFGRIFEGHGD